MAALGVVEIRSFSGAVEALDAMCKDARVSVKQVKRPGGGHVTLLAEGDVAAVASAVEAGVSAASHMCSDIICSFVLPNPHEELMEFLG